MFDRLIAREADRRASGNDAFRNMQRAEYVAGRKDYAPKDGLRSYGFGPRAATATEKSGADAFKAEAMKRLQAGDSLLPQVADPGRFQFVDDPAGRFRFDPALLRESSAEK